MSVTRIDAHVSRLVHDERIRQDVKWGSPKDLPNGSGPDSLPLAFLQPIVEADIYSTAVEMQTWAKEHTDNAMHLGRVTYADILNEEYLEALAEDDPEMLFDELIQVAAVAQKWCRALIEHQGVRR